MQVSNSQYSAVPTSYPAVKSEKTSVPGESSAAIESIPSTNPAPCYDQTTFSFQHNTDEQEEKNGMYRLLHYMTDSEKDKKKDIRNTTTKRDYDTSGIYSMVSRSASKAGVKAAMTETHRRIQALQSSTMYGTTSERTRAKRTIASLQKLLTRGSRKIRQLDKEELLKIRQRRAAEKEEMKKARQLALEEQSERKRRSRMDHTLLQEGQSAHRYQNAIYEHKYIPEPTVYNSTLPVTESLPPASSCDLPLSDSAPVQTAVDV